MKLGCKSPAETGLCRNRCLLFTFFHGGPEVHHQLNCLLVISLCGCSAAGRVWHKPVLTVGFLHQYLRVPIETGSQGSQRCPWCLKCWLLLPEKSQWFPVRWKVFSNLRGLRGSFMWLISPWLGGSGNRQCCSSFPGQQHHPLRMSACTPSGVKNTCPNFLCGIPQLPVPPGLHLNISQSSCPSDTCSPGKVPVAAHHGYDESWQLIAPTWRQPGIGKTYTRTHSFCSSANVVLSFKSSLFVPKHCFFCVCSWGGDDLRGGWPCLAPVVGAICRLVSRIATGEPKRGAKSFILPLSSSRQLCSLFNIHHAARTDCSQHLLL